MNHLLNLTLNPRDSRMLQYFDTPVKIEKAFTAGEVHYPYLYLSFKDLYSDGTIAAVVLDEENAKAIAKEILRVIDERG